MSKLITVVRRFGKKIRSLLLRKSSRNVGKLVQVQIQSVTIEQQSKPSDAKINHASDVTLRVLTYAAADYVIYSVDHRLFLERLFVEVPAQAIDTKETKEPKENTVEKVKATVDEKPKAKMDRFRMMALSFQRLNPGFELKQSTSGFFDIRQTRKVTSVSS